MSAIQSRREIADALRNIGVGAILLALVLYLAGIVTAGLAWHCVLRSLGESAPSGRNVPAVLGRAAGQVPSWRSLDRSLRQELVEGQRPNKPISMATLSAAATAAGTYVDGVAISIGIGSPGTESSNDVTTS